MDQGALLADNARISKELVEVQNKLELAEAVASEKVSHLESTINALTRQSTNDAFASAKRCARSRHSHAPGWSR